jgi:hypothetical protein
MRTQPTRVRFAKAELDELRARADANGKHVSTYIRDAAIAYCKVGMDDSVASEVRRDVRELQQSFDGFDATLIEVLLLLREVLGKNDPQAVARIAAASKRLNPTRSSK